MIKCCAFLCLSLVIFSTYTAEFPEDNIRWGNAPEEKISRLTDSINRLLKQLHETRKDLLDMQVQVLHTENGSIAIYCTNVINSPGFKIGSEYELETAIEQCLRKNKLIDAKTQRIIRNLVIDYFQTYQRIVQEKQELEKLKKRYERYKKPALENRTT